MKQFLEYTTIAVIGLVAGFYMGRDSIQVKEQIKYIKGDTIREKIAIPIPYQVEIPSEPVYIYKTDTLVNEILQKVDTAAILSDWISKREYKQQLFDNKYGTLVLNSSVQYNRLQNVDYSYTPLEKQTTLVRQQVWTPFIEASYNTLNYVGVGGGLFYNNWGVGIQYTTDFDKKGIDIGLKYKF